MRHPWASVLLLLNLVACGLWPSSSAADKVKDRPWTVRSGGYTGWWVFLVYGTALEKLQVCIPWSPVTPVDLRKTHVPASIQWCDRSYGSGADQI